MIPKREHGYATISASATAAATATKTPIHGVKPKKFQRSVVV
jgi:hypothetical protein